MTGKSSDICVYIYIHTWLFQPKLTCMACITVGVCTGVSRTRLVFDSSAVVQPAAISPRLCLLRNQVRRPVLNRLRQVWEVPGQQASVRVVRDHPRARPKIDMCPWVGLMVKRLGYCFGEVRKMPMIWDHPFNDIAHWSTGLLDSLVGNISAVERLSNRLTEKGPAKVNGMSMWE